MALPPEFEDFIINTLKVSPAPRASAPDRSFAAPPSDAMTNPYGPDSVFSIPTTPAVSIAAPAAPPSASNDVTLESAISAWTQARTRMMTNLGLLESAIVAAFLGEAPKLIADLQKKVTKLSGFARELDPSLADALNKAKSAGDPAGRKKALGTARTILDKFRSHLKAQDKFLAQIDANPFGVKLNLWQELSSSLDEVGKALH